MDEIDSFTLRLRTSSHSRQSIQVWKNERLSGR